MNQEKNIESNRLRNLIAQGHTVLPMALLGVIIFADVIEHPENINTLFAEYGDLIWIVALFVVVSLLLQMLVKTIDHKIFRWGVFAFTVFIVGFTLLHSGDHIKEYLREGVNLHLPFDFLFYTVGIWTTILSWKWVRLKLED